ncbi:hypothetical protein SAMN05216412_101372 [Nitrosospira multiformis]|uniref:Uncharacterized protein n=1 Tax=Nitrosospira multiformis TaxID=1231 RepID=A0A1H9YT79_9PROT|nr:hypothetical protein SAMN05216412_101372 [Nitrosospira multiformis]
MRVNQEMMSKENLLAITLTWSESLCFRPNLMRLLRDRLFSFSRADSKGYPAKFSYSVRDHTLRKFEYLSKKKSLERLAWPVTSPNGGWEIFQLRKSFVNPFN